ncbi:MAG: hypothetical protein H0T89_02990 [Deltaproteobacteria bacterium]|nr:hypothetical protein [Deltaproteobacteria bacterium]MDQ3298213.1 hypothetical protein [Myxococcota bacterium]
MSATACRDDGGGSGDDTPLPDAPPVGGNVTIMQVQDDAMPVGTPVTLKGVIVTAIDAYGNRTGDIFVEDPAGGPFSGIKVFGPPLDQVAALAVGDIVDITNAEKDEFALTSDLSGRKVTEIKGAAGGMMTITKKGTGTVPAPVAVDAKAIAAMPKAMREAEWEKWEGVLVTVTGARQLAATRTFGSNPGPDSNEFRITGIARVQSGLAELPADAGFGVCYERITGVVDYFFNDIVLPRATTDVVGGGTGCNALATSVVSVQTGTNVELANLANVVVTGRDDLGTNKGIWVADGLAGAENNGVFVFTGAMLDVAWTVGTRLNVQGAVEEFDLPAMAGGTPMGNTVTEISSPTIAVAAAATAPPTPATAVPVTTLNDIGAAGEPWEGVLVQVQLMKVTALQSFGKIELTSNAGAKLIMDDEAFVLSPPAVNTCYATVTGLMHVAVFDDLRTINPRSAADVVVGTGCN